MVYCESIEEKTAGMREYLQFLKELSKKDPEKAREISKKSLVDTGIIDEDGNLLPPYNGQNVTETDFTRGPKIKKR